MKPFDIQQFKNRPAKQVELIRYDMFIYVKPMMAKTVVDIQKLQPDNSTPFDFAAQVVLACVVNEDGKPLFDSMDELLTMPPELVEDMAHAVIDTNVQKKE